MVEPVSWEYVRSHLVIGCVAKRRRSGELAIEVVGPMQGQLIFTMGTWVQTGPGISPETLRDVTALMGDELQARLITTYGISSQLPGMS